MLNAKYCGSPAKRCCSFQSDLLSLSNLIRLDPTGLDPTILWICGGICIQILPQLEVPEVGALRLQCAPRAEPCFAHFLPHCTVDTSRSGTLKATQASVVHVLGLHLCAWAVVLMRKSGNWCLTIGHLCSNAGEIQFQVTAWQ